MTLRRLTPWSAGAAHNTEPTIRDSLAALRCNTLLCASHNTSPAVAVSHRRASLPFCHPCLNRAILPCRASAAWRGEVYPEHLAQHITAELTGRATQN